MNAATIGDGGEQIQAGLFGQGELPAAPSDARPAKRGGAARVMSPQRHQVELCAVDLDSLLALDYPARTVWAFVQSMDLGPLYARIKSVDSRGGAPAIDPAILRPHLGVDEGGQNSYAPAPSTTGFEFPAGA